MCKWHMFDHFVAMALNATQDTFFIARSLRGFSKCNAKALHHNHQKKQTQKTPRVWYFNALTLLFVGEPTWNPPGTSPSPRKISDDFSFPSHWKHHQGEDQNTGDEAEEKMIIALPDTSRPHHQGYTFVTKRVWVR